MTAVTVLLDKRLCEKYQSPIPSRRSTLLRASEGSLSLLSSGNCKWKGRTLIFVGTKKPLWRGH